MRRFAFGIAGLTILSILITGYCVFCGGHALEIPLVREIQDPHLFPGDPFVETLSHYPSALWWLVAQISRWIDLEVVLAAGFLLTRVLLIMAGFLLGRTLFPAPSSAGWMAAIFLALAPQPLFGSGTTVEPFFEQSGLFMPLFLLALASLLRGEAGRFAAFWGLGFLINPMYGLWAGLVFAGTWIADKERLSWRSYAKAAPLFLLIAAPVLWPALTAGASEPPDAATWIWVNRAVHSIHLFPETWSHELTIRYAGFLALLVTTAWLVRRQTSRVSRLVSAWAALGIFFAGLTYLSVAIEWRALITLHPSRATDLLYLCGGVAIVAAGTYLATVWNGPFGLIGFASLFSLTVYLLVPLVSPWTLAIALGAAGLISVTTALVVRQPDRQQSILRVLTAAWLSVMVLSITVAALDLHANLEGGIRTALYRRPPAHIQQIAAWARQHTTEDAVFFHEPISWDWSHFRYLAERPVFVTWKDAAGSLWDPPYSDEWSRRFAAFGLSASMRQQWDPALAETERGIRQGLRSRYRIMKDKDIRAILRKYRIDYWVASVRAESSYPVVFEVPGYKVLALNSPAASPPVTTE